MHNGCFHIPMSGNTKGTVMDVAENIVTYIKHPYKTCMYHTIFT